MALRGLQGNASLAIYSAFTRQGESNQQHSSWFMGAVVLWSLTHIKESK